MKTSARRLAVAVLGLLAGCGSSGGGDKLVGQWLYTSADGASGIGIAFRADGTYTTTILRATSGTTANTQVENGTYADLGSSVAFTPVEWSCTGMDTAETDAYSISGNTLSLVTVSGLISLTRNTAPAAGNIILTTGCFTPDGAFAPHPIGADAQMADACYVAPDWNVSYQDCGVHNCVIGCGVLPQDGTPGHLLPAGCSVSIGTSTPRTAVCRSTCAECMAQ